MKFKLLFLFALILLTPLISANSFGYNYLDNKIQENITNEYINNTYINQTVELNTTQFEIGEPVTIKTSWLTSFIEAVSKWANYYNSSEVDTLLNDKADSSDLNDYALLSGANFTGDITVKNIYGDTEMNIKFPDNHKADINIEAGGYTSGSGVVSGGDINLKSGRGGGAGASTQGNIELFSYGLLSLFSSLGDMNIGVADGSGNRGNLVFAGGDMIGNSQGKASSVIFNAGDASQVGVPQYVRADGGDILFNIFRGNANVNAKNGRIMFNFDGNTIAEINSDGNIKASGSLALGTNSHAGLSAGDINASTIYYNVLQAKSPIILCSYDWCMVELPQAKESFYLQKDENWNVLQITDKSGKTIDSKEFIYENGFIVGSVKLDLKEVLNKTTTLRDEIKERKTCLENNYVFRIDGCYNVYNEVVTYEEATQDEIIYVKETQEYSCTQLNPETLREEETICSRQIETTEIERIQRVFKENCNWNKEIGYYCKVEVKI